MSTLASTLLDRLRSTSLLQRIGLAAAAGLTLRLVSSYLSRRSFYARHEYSTVVITGASQGLGAATARVLAAALPRARIVLLARTKPLLDSLASELRVGGRAGAVEVHAVDCSQGAAMLAVAQCVGPTDIVIANAGAGTWRAIFEGDAHPAETERCLAAPLASALHTAHAFLPAMLAGAPRGSVFCVTQSPASRLPWPGCTAYTAARWGLRGLCEALRADLPRGVAVCEVVLSEITDSAYFTTSNPGSKGRLPWIAPLFGSLTSQGAARAVLRALEGGAQEHVAPWQLSWGLSTLWIPGVARVFAAAVRATGWSHA